LIGYNIIMKVGDLVRVKIKKDHFHFRPKKGSVGIIVEISYSEWIGVCYFVYINDVGWKFTEGEIEVIEHGSG